MSNKKRKPISAAEKQRRAAQRAARLEPKTDDPTPAGEVPQFARMQGQAIAAHDLAAGRTKPRVFVAHPTGPWVDPRFHACMVHLLMHDAKNEQYMVDGAHMTLHTTNLPLARNQIVNAFLTAAVECDYLWFMDNDQTFPPNILDRMVELADPVERPIVGALGYSYNAPEKTQRSWPTVWGWNDEGPVRWSTTPRNTLLRVGATGTGCVLIHRSVFEKVAALPVVPERLKDDGTPLTYAETSWPWFQYADWTSPDGKPDVMGEDLTFFSRVRQAEIPVYVHTGIEFGHVKPIEINSVWHYADLPFERRCSENYVVIPVRDRLDLTRHLLEQLAAQGAYSGIFVFDNGSGPETKQYLAEQQIALVFDAPGATIHQMWNAGITEALERWPKANIAILNNDLEIGPKFLDMLATTLRAGPDQLVAVSPNYDGRPMTENLQLVQGICGGRYDGTGGLAGFAFMVKGEAITAGLPLFDERFEYWFGDTDWTLTLDRLGAVYGIARDATVTHLGGGSQTDLLFADETNPKKARDEQRFREKWEPLGLRLDRPTQPPPVKVSASPAEPPGGAFASAITAVPPGGVTEHDYLIAQHTPALLADPGRRELSLEDVTAALRDAK